ncbi:hypothetical protein EU245_13060 [Lentibacillus lipolyticus]|nr:hypothetical protein EU245_13060 [Lentibacillus lipolyticus]
MLEKRQDCLVQSFWRMYMVQINVSHTLINPETIKQLLEGHGMTEEAQCEILFRGLNDTYEITDQLGRKYIFRLYRTGWRDKQAILFELDGLSQLAAHRFQLSVPVQKLDGNYIYELHAPEGVRFGVLFTYAEGERPQINTDTSRLIGASLGQMHDLTTGFTSVYKRGFELDTHHLLDEPAEVIAPVLEKHVGPEAVEILHIVANNTKADLAVLDLEKGFCHGDFHNHNMHLHDGGVEVFDFDCCAIGYRGYDLAVSWWNLKNNYKKMEEECWDAFLEGYSAQRNLAADDMKSLPLFITARRMWLLGTMIANQDVWGTSWINERTLKLFIGQLRTDRPGDTELQEFDNKGII